MTAGTFLRYLNVAARATFMVGVAPILTVQNLTGEGLRMTWELSQSDTSSLDQGRVEIFNLGLPQQKILQSALANKSAPPWLSFEIGWEKIVTRVMTGTIWRFKASEFVGEADQATVVEFGDGAGAYIENSPLASGLPELAEAAWLVHFEDIAKRFHLIPPARLRQPQWTAVLNMSPIVISNPLPRFIGTGSATDRMNAMVASLGPDYDWGFQNGQLVLFNKGLFADTTPPQIIQPDTGLLNHTVQDDGTVEISALAHPSINPGQQMLVNALEPLSNTILPIAENPLRVSSIGFFGDTDNDSRMLVKGRKVVI